MKKLILILFLLKLCPLAGTAQSSISGGKIHGQISTDKGKTAEYATIRLLLSSDSSFVKGLTTDMTGKYEFSNLAYGSYLVSVSSMGYKTLHSAPVHISAKNPEMTADLIVLEDTHQLSEVSITSTIPFIETQVDKTVLNVENSVMAAGSSAMEVLLKAPGVMIDKDNNISLKGKQGVTVMIDGKPTYLSAEDLGTMLRNMSASNISHMEIISNPSSKYDAAGNSGIINIKTKKNKQQGLNGSINMGTGYSKNALFNSGANLNYRYGKFNWFGNYNYAHTNRYLSIAVDRSVINQQITTLFSQFSENNSLNNNNTYKVGTDYFINDKNTLGFMMSGYINTGNGTGLNKTQVFNKDMRLDSFLVMNNGDEKRYQSQSYNLNYKTVLDTSGQELSFDLDYSTFHKNKDELLNNAYYTAGGQSMKPLKWSRSYSPSDINIRSAKADYTYPISKSFKVEAGVKTSWVKTDNDYSFEQQQTGNWVNDPLKSNHFIYEENINASYLSVSQKFKKTSIQAGLRAEFTHSKGNSITQNTLVDTTYTRLFPTLFVSQQLTDKQTLGFSYSQRIDRPSYEDLNPFLMLLDEYTYVQGNPYLRPEYTNSFDLNYSYDGMLGFSAGYSHKKDAIVSVTEQNDINKTTKGIRRNMEAEIIYYLGANASLPINKWWTTTNNVDGFHLAYKDTELNVKKLAVQLSSTHNFTLPQGLRLELSGRYQSPLNYGIFQLKQQYQIDAGLQKSIFNKKGSLKLGVSDLFDTQKTSIATTFRNMNMQINERQDTRKARLTFSYRFGNSSQKPANRKSGVEDETGRIKNGN
ncbi:MAG TPA: outer membrane beta-barrel protein [Daejeonella sp.]|nr:outer membrane beta-barrel protein [Daejeonella sp.]